VKRKYLVHWKQTTDLWSLVDAESMLDAEETVHLSGQVLENTTDTTILDVTPFELEWVKTFAAAEPDARR
jgi:hypothetical protein